MANKTIGGILFVIYISKVIILLSKIFIQFSFDVWTLKLVENMVHGLHGFGC